MGKISAVIFWWMTVSLPHNKAISEVQHQQHESGPSVQDYVADVLPQHPPVWDQTVPGATRWDQEKVSRRESLTMDLPLWHEGRLVTKVPDTHTPPIHMHGNDPHPILLYSMLIVFNRVMYVRFPTDPWVHFTSTWSFILLNAPTVAAADTGKISLYDCGATASAQPLVQQFNLNMPDPCSNASSVYLPPC